MASKRSLRLSKLLNRARRARGAKKSAWKAWAQSVRGPAHIEEGLPNQDAALVCVSKEYTLAVAADGVGEKPRADTGSAMACRAVRDAAAASGNSTAMTDDEFAALIYENWLRLIAPLSPAECSTTCMFALRKDGVIFLGQTGDGLAAYWTADDGKCARVTEAKDYMFANMTETALSGTYKAGAWRFARYREQNNSMAVLCTDGISETIEPESIDTFIKNLYAFSLANSEEDCAKSAEQWLANWPAPACHDDKTVAVMIRGGKP